MVHLRVSAGPSLNGLKPISELVNTGETYPISSPYFEGEIVANIKGFVDESGEKKDDGPYFAQEERQGITWSIMVRGRFLTPISADDVLFGNTFDRPLKLPWGTGAALKFANYIDPTLSHDLQSQSKPWALSPLISTMPHFSHAHISTHDNSALTSPFPPTSPLEDNTSDLYLTKRSAFQSSSSISSESSISSSLSIASGSSHRPKLKAKSSLAKLAAASRSVTSLRSVKSKKSLTNFDNGDTNVYNFKSASERRSFFSKVEARQAIEFGPNDVISTDFCYGFFSFYPTISLRLPGGLEFDVQKYWDNQPARFVCCARKDWAPSPATMSPVVSPTDYGEELRDEDETPRVKLNFNERHGEADVEDEDEEAPWGKVFWCIAIEMVDNKDEGKPNGDVD